jgi:hypothetical protein
MRFSFPLDSASAKSAQPSDSDMYPHIHWPDEVRRPLLFCRFQFVTEHFKLKLWNLLSLAKIREEMSLNTTTILALQNKRLTTLAVNPHAFLLLLQQ